eukprot:6891435-Pyramimonas_sp.AAC.1
MASSSREGGSGRTGWPRLAAVMPAARVHTSGAPAGAVALAFQGRALFCAGISSLGPRVVEQVVDLSGLSRFLP